jgi:predicted DNA-binding transcriptional regulator YafY
MRNVGMVLGIATGGAVLYAFAPAYILQKATLESSEAIAFLLGLQHAYLAGAILTGIAVITSLGRSGEEKLSRKESG